MTKKIFALKVPSKLKRTMEFISKEVGTPFSKLYYQGIEESTLIYLGVVLLHNLDVTNVEKSGGFDELKHLSNLETYLQKKNISPIEKFIELIRDENIRQRIENIFSNIDISDRLYSYQDVDKEDLCRYLGERYLHEYKDISKIDLRTIKDTFLEKMIKNYYDAMAIGTMSQLSQEWERNLARTEALRDELGNGFDKTFRSFIVEPISSGEEGAARGEKTADRMKESPKRKGAVVSKPKKTKVRKKVKHKVGK